MKNKAFDPDCRLCPRLAAHLDDVREKYPDYYSGPVASFGVARPKLLIVGLAPGLHGANASGRTFAGDHAGIMLYETLHRYGFASRPVSKSADDGLRLRRCRISNAVKCLPPQNKPVGAEINTCNQFLAAELAELPRPVVVLALGTIAHRAVLRALGLKLNHCKFGHAAVHTLDDGLTLLDSYHCSRYNTQTRRLLPAMFDAVFDTAKRLVEES